MWDCHLHAFGPDYPLAPNRAYDPPVTSLAPYLEQAERAGIAQCVFVQPSIYGDDNSAVLDAAAAGQGAHRAIIAAAAGLEPQDLPSLHARGVRGLRLLSPRANPAAVARLRALMPALRDLGWHVAASLDTTEPGALDELLDGITVPLVVDHFGRPPLNTTDPAPLAPLLVHVAAGRVWVKLSSPYQVTTGAYADLAPIARALCRARPEAVLFASNWPHIGAPVPRDVPDIADLLKLAAGWLDLSLARARTLFEGNARALYA